MAAQLYDPRTPQGTLRAFATALNEGNLTKAASYISSTPEMKEKPNLSEIERVMRSQGVRYSIERLNIAETTDTTTISFALVLHTHNPKVLSRYIATWAVLHNTNKGDRWNEHWEIDPEQTLHISDNPDPFRSLISLMSGQRYEGEERQKNEIRMSKYMQMYWLLRDFACNNHDKLALQSSNLRATLLPYYPTLDVLLRPGKDENGKMSFNDRLTNVSLQKIRFPQRTVLLYNGTDGQIEFGHDGRTVITFADGHVGTVRATDAISLIWSP